MKNKILQGLCHLITINSDEIFEKLTEKKITCAVREGVVRFAPHFYNTKDEIDVVIDELKKIQNALDK